MFTTRRLRWRFVDRSTRPHNHEHPPWPSWFNHDESAPEGDHLLNHLKNPWLSWCNHDDSAPVGDHLESPEEWEPLEPTQSCPAPPKKWVIHLFPKPHSLRQGNTYPGSLRFRLLDTNGIMIELTCKGSLKRNPCGTDPPDSKNKTSLATLMQSRWFCTKILN